MHLIKKSIEEKNSLLLNENKNLAEIDSLKKLLKTTRVKLHQNNFQRKVFIY